MVLGRAFNVELLKGAVSLVGTNAADIQRLNASGVGGSRAFCIVSGWLRIGFCVRLRYV